jgi:hypothetical protein
MFITILAWCKRPDSEWWTWWVLHSQPLASMDSYRLRMIKCRRQASNGLTPESMVKRRLPSSLAPCLRQSRTQCHGLRHEVSKLLDHHVWYGVHFFHPFRLNPIHDQVESRLSYFHAHHFHGLKVNGMLKCLDDHISTIGDHIYR